MSHFHQTKAQSHLDDMTVKIACRIEDEARDDERVFILGTSEADKKNYTLTY
ncbi:hypothetical protein Lpar_2098 [Legionella parisiensis]|uniref:Uncharacterized protein n=1 Tax=Legionella parisiensis TaxID=45071 RepID=A0A1E5JTV2_9GAMM|nr:hypothetical protein Lpar_2098 [Legionella parisiensis]OEH47951.1 hypothetical protein lpari_01139 [Legionella parisiensis]STX76770.1 Uncharacterised protein [Legionella parisiensis]